MRRGVAGGRRMNPGNESPLGRKRIHLVPYQGRPQGYKIWLLKKEEWIDQEDEREYNSPQ